MDLYILRHGIAVEPGTLGYAKDSQRPLTEEGIREMREISGAMEKLGLAPETLFSSPYVRARQTAEIAAETLGLQKNIKITETLACEGNPEQLIREIRKIAGSQKSVMLVGHEPYLSGLISMLVSGTQAVSIVMKKGGLCKLSTADLKYGRCASLEWLLTPKQMTRIKNGAKS